ncbi:MAG: hypothetical protein IPL52_06615 [Flavobacteriales bacterium]|nr:hypothetical protein [Flavobacteriales bacterium]
MSQEQAQLVTDAISPEKKTAPRQYEDVDPYNADHRDYVLIQSRVNLMAVSQMSDLKANLMLTLSAVMLQFAVVKAADHELHGSHLPYWVIVVGSLITIVFSALSTLPRSRFRLEERSDDGRSPAPKNLLYFGTFIHLSLPAFQRHMNNTLSSPPHTHEAIIEELHAHGRYIARRKYFPLMLAYLSFLLTWLVAAAAYIMT